MYERAPKFFGVSLLALATIPVVYYSVTYVNEPTLYEGERMEARPCRECGGSGKDASLKETYPMLGDRCMACAGRGTVDVIIPCDKRPIRTWGAVVDLGKSGDLYEYTVPSSIPTVPILTIPPARTDILGALSGITVVLEPLEGDPIELKSTSTGRFAKPLLPGIYTVKVSSPGFEPLEEKLEIKPYTEPIWLERAIIHRESDVWEGGQSSRGLCLLVALVPKGDERTGFLRVFPAGP